MAACVAYPRIGTYQTSPGEWALTFCLGFLYIWLLVTVAVLTFRKGYTALGLPGLLLADPVADRRHPPGQERVPALG